MTAGPDMSYTSDLVREVREDKDLPLKAVMVNGAPKPGGEGDGLSFLMMRGVDPGVSNGSACEVVLMMVGG